MTKDKEGTIVIIVLIAIIISLIAYVIYSIRHDNRKYEYALNKKTYQSEKCFQEDGDCYCTKNGKLIRVDNYYRI